jgi:hypothetical protein
MRFRPHIASCGLAIALIAAVLSPRTPFVGVSRAAGTPVTADEYDLKAAFLYNFAKFVEWPSDKLKPDDSPLIVGVAGQDAFEHVSAVIREKKIDKHDIVVRLLADKNEIKGCHILFLTRSQKQETSVMVAAANQAGVLTIGETDEFMEAGGMVRFFIESDNLRLEIAPDTARRAGLGIKANALSTLINKGIARLK